MLRNRIVYCHLKVCSAWGRMRYENKCPIWNKTPDLNNIYIPQSTLNTWGPILGRVILYTYQLIIPPPRLMTSSFAIVLHICKKALAEYSRMNWGCDYMTDMSSVVLLSASLRKSWTMFSHQFLRWVLDAISNAGRLTEEQRQATAKVDSKTSVTLKSLTIQSQSKSTILIQS